MSRGLPDFLIIGAMKSGTTSLYACLKRHPEIFLPKNKEPRFFCSEELCRGTGPGDKTWIRAAVRDVEAYRALFAGSEKFRAAGEASPIYLWDSGCIERIYRTLPGVKLIAVLRDPVDRAYSHYCYRRRRGEEPVSRFEKAVEAEPGRIAAGWHPRWFYLKRGLYYAQLKPWYDRFGAGAIRIFLTEELEKEGPRVLREIFEFLGVDPSVRIDAGRRENQGKRPRFDLPSGPLMELMKKAPLVRNWIGWAEKQYRPMDEVDPRTRLKLAPYFRQDLERLPELTGKDISCWPTAQIR